MRKNKENIAAICQQTIKYAHNIINQATTLNAMNELDFEAQQTVASQVVSARSHGKKYENQINFNPDFSRLDFNEFLYKLNKQIEGVKQNGAGNCQEYCLISLAYITEHHPGIFAEVFMLEGEHADHVVLVLNRKKDSEENNPMSWGEDAYFCDVLYQEFYPACDYLAKLKNYRCETNENGRVKNWLEPFDPKKHCLSAEKYYDDAVNSDFLSQFDKPEEMQKLHTYFLVKLAIIEKLLDMLLFDCKEVLVNQNINNESVIIGNKETEFIKEVSALQDKINELYLQTNFEIYSYKELQFKLSSILLEIFGKFKKIILTAEEKVDIKIKQSTIISNYFHFFSDKKQGSNVYFLNDIKTIEEISPAVNDIYNYIKNREYDFNIMTKLNEDNKGIPDLKIIKEQVDELFKEILPSILNYYRSGLSI